jgi:hypothetical protein
MPDYRTIAYLQRGTPTQRRAYAALTELGIMVTLGAYNARLAGTIPIDVDIPGSDLDILCHTPEPEMDAFEALLRREYGHPPDFTLARKRRYGHPIILCDFTYRDFPIQVYASPTPVDAQRAWVHLLAEARLLADAGPEAREAVRALKRAGIKTEPAFAQVFGLSGDAYEALYELGAVAGQQKRR